MMDEQPAQTASDSPEAVAAAYDAEAAAIGYFCPEIAFGMVYRHLRPGQTVLDLGIGTGLAAELFRRAGLLATGLDNDPQMLAAARSKGFTDVVRHDLTRPPYPFAAASFDHVICVGVLPFLPDPSPVVAEAARVLRQDGCFVFMVLARAKGEAPELAVAADDTGIGEAVTLHQHSDREVREWLGAYGLAPPGALTFQVPVGVAAGRTAHGRMYVTRKY